MFRPLHKLVALAALASFGLVSLGSHALHEWSGCCDEQVAEQSSGCCHGCHCQAKPAAESRRDLSAESFRSDAPRHDADSCAACAMLAKLKTSVFELASAPVAESIVQERAEAPAILFLAAPLRVHSARGPPAPLA